MNSQNLALVSMTLEGKLDKQDKFLALQRCENLDDNSISLLSTINFKSPLTGLLLHWLLGIFGGGRFYKGDIALGVLYLVAFVLVCVCAGYDEDLFNLVFLLYILAYGVDFYLIYKGIQKDNFQKLQNFLLFQNFSQQQKNETTKAF